MLKARGGAACRRLLPGIMIGVGLLCGAGEFPHFQDVIRLLRANLPGVEDEELNRAAVEGLLQSFYPRVMLVTNPPVGEQVEPAGEVGQTQVYDGVYGYMRISNVGPGLAVRLSDDFQRLEATNRLKGLVLDLRYAGGTDYKEAGRTVDKFVARERVLLEWPGVTVRSTTKDDPIRLPLAVLMNRRTSGAAEALAALFREVHLGMLIGTRTSGAVNIYEEHDLPGGNRLRIASGSVRIGEGGTVTDAGVAPDIGIAVDQADEAIWFEDPYRVLAVAGARTDGSGLATNRPARRRMNEAELVRLQREGLDRFQRETLEPGPLDRISPGGPGTEVEVETPPLVRDPALARALDLLKGIALMEQPRRP